MAKLYSNRGIRLIQALQHRAFTWFWAGQTISTLGDGAFTTALAVVVYQLTKSSLAMGLLLMAQITPEVIFTLIGGAVADRLPRRTVLLASDASRALIVLSIALLGWLNLLHLWHLFAMAILFGITLSFFHPSYRALTPELVPKEHFSSANALTELSIQLGNLLGPALGAGLIALAAGSTAAAFAFDGLTFVISVCSLLIIRSTPPLSQQTPSLAQKRVNLSRQIDIFVVNYPCYENRENTTPPLRRSSQTPWFASVDRPAMGQ